MLVLKFICKIAQMSADSPTFIAHNESKRNLKSFSGGGREICREFESGNLYNLDDNLIKILVCGKCSNYSSLSHPLP